MQMITPTPEMVSAAKSLGQGELLVVYRDGNTIRAETERGRNPLVWRKNGWRAMVARWKQKGKSR